MTLRYVWRSARISFVEETVKGNALHSEGGMDLYINCRVDHFMKLSTVIIAS